MNGDDNEFINMLDNKQGPEYYFLWYCTLHINAEHMIYIF